MGSPRGQVDGPGPAAQGAHTTGRAAACHDALDPLGQAGKAPQKGCPHRPSLDLANAQLVGQGRVGHAVHQAICDALGGLALGGLDLRIGFG